MFTEAYMQRALLAALLLAPVCAVLGVFVTARRMAFFSDTVSHAALAGIALGFWLGLPDPTLPMLGMGVAVALATLWLKENTDLLTDTIMALLLAGSVALGITILSLLKAPRGDIHRFLFGDVLAVSPTDVWLAAGLVVAAGIAAVTGLNRLALTTVQEEMAHVCGASVRQMNYVFVLVLTAAVALSIRLLGIVLVTALLVIAPAAARNVSSNLRQHLGWSLVLGWIAAVGGTVAAYHLDLPCGPAIVLCGIGLFLLTLVLRSRRRQRCGGVALSR